ncbi:MAG: GspE/PulE family protein [Acidimicrobiia bacterium]
MASASQSHLLTRTNRLRIGELFLAQGLITDEQLDAALAEQRDTGERLGKVLLKHKAITEVDLVRTLATHFGIDFVDLEDRVLDPSVCTVVREPFARKHRLIPIEWADGALVVAMVNPTDVFALDDLRSIVNADVRPVMAEPLQLSRAIERTWGTESSVDMLHRVQEEAEDYDLGDDSGGVSVEDAPVIQFVNQLIARAVTERASDLHVEPGPQEVRVRFRVDGVLHDVMTVPRSIQSTLISRVKIMADMDIAERRLPQDGRMSVKVGGQNIALRVVSLPTAFGESVILRLLDETTGVLNLEDLGFLPEQEDRYREAFMRPWGAIVVCGPTGSGKSTTLYATLSELNGPERAIVTVEDPIEYRLAGLKQMQVNRKAGLTFANALRSILRADPDVVLVGEVRDGETARIATEAALTGHLVLTSLHTNDAASAATRLVEMGVEPFLVTSSLTAVVAQRLARRLCEKCKEASKPYDEELAEFKKYGIAAKEIKLFRRKGCPACQNTGYRGRLAIHEVMPFTEELGHLILQRPTASQVQEVAMRQGMITMMADGMRKVANGLLSMEELFRAIG